MINKLKAFLLSKKKLILYVVFGGLTTVVDFAVSISLYSVINHHAANVIAWMCAVVFAFVVNKKWVFNSKSTGIRAVSTEFAGFCGGRVFSLLLQEGIFIVAVDWLSFKTLPVKIVAAVIVVIVNYILSKLVFEKNVKKEV
jgi:putative flippase GtrA